MWKFSGDEEKVQRPTPNLEYRKAPSVAVFNSALDVGRGAFDVFDLNGSQRQCGALDRRPWIDGESFLERSYAPARSRDPQPRHFRGRCLLFLERRAEPPRRVAFLSRSGDPRC